MAAAHHAAPPSRGSLRGLRHGGGAAATTARRRRFSITLPLALPPAPGMRWWTNLYLNGLGVLELLENAQTVLEDVLGRRRRPEARLDGKVGCRCWAAPPEWHPLHARLR